MNKGTKISLYPRFLFHHWTFNANRNLRIRTRNGRGRESLGFFTSATVQSDFSSVIFISWTFDTSYVDVGMCLFVLIVFRPPFAIALTHSRFERDMLNQEGV